MTVTDRKASRLLSPAMISLPLSVPMRENDTVIYENIRNAECEIERFEKDFIVPLNESLETKRSDKSEEEVIYQEVENKPEVKEKHFHSSSDSFDVDSGAFSRLSTPDFSLKSEDVLDSSPTSSSTFSPFSSLSSSPPPSSLDSSKLVLDREQMCLLCSLSSPCSSSFFPSSSPPPPHCAPGCRAIVTVNGKCYQC